jgi:catechol 2,3-dioxygenase-like lactoylglutathione lyase family enzyme
MLGNSNASANLAVKDLDTARKFYEGTLGLKQVESMDDELIVYRSGEDENGEMGFETADPGQDPRGTSDLMRIWTILDSTPEGRGADWYPKLEYSS